jgi:hypothetical protein
MLHYPVKILLAFGEAVSGNRKIFKWLMNNGYPELAALANSLQTNEEAFDWLMKNGYPHFAALSNAIDDDDKAYAWLNKHKFVLLTVLADASRGKKEAINILYKKGLKVFVIISKKILEIKNQQKFNYEDYHKIHF